MNETLYAQVPETVEYARRYAAKIQERVVIWPVRDLQGRHDFHQGWLMMPVSVYRQQTRGPSETR